MSGGWIKFEKELRTDPRVRRLAKALADRYALQGLGTCNASALPGVTLVLGALANLWCLADEHAREDDTLDMSASELDDYLGIPGFSDLLPPCWLEIIDENTIKLPDFQAHNGVEAKKVALGTKRVQRHRERKKREGVTGGNADALPDQDRDQDPDLNKKPPFPLSRGNAPHERPKRRSRRVRADGATAWDRALEAAQRGNSTANDETIDEAVRRMGGYTQIGQSHLNQRDDNRRRFREIYERMLEQRQAGGGAA